MTTAQDQTKVCIDQLVGRLQEAETVRRSEQSTIEALRQQVNAYREDFDGEQLDRHRAQERVVNLERQVAALKNRVRITAYVGIYQEFCFRERVRLAFHWLSTSKRLCIVTLL